MVAAVVEPDVDLHSAIYTFSYSKPWRVTYRLV